MGPRQAGKIRAHDDAIGVGSRGHLQQLHRNSEIYQSRTSTVLFRRPVLVNGLDSTSNSAGAAATRKSACYSVSQGAHPRPGPRVPSLQFAENSRSLEIDPYVGEEMFSLPEFFRVLHLERAAIRQSAGGNQGFIAAALPPNTVAD